MARRRSYGRKSRSSGGGRRRSGGGRKRGAGGRYVRSGGGGGGGGSRSGSISPKMLLMLGGGAVLAYLAYQKFGGVHPAVHAAAMAQQPQTANQIIDAGAAAGDQTDFNSMTDIGLPIPYNPAPGTNSGPLQL